MRPKPRGGHSTTSGIADVPSNTSPTSTPSTTHSGGFYSSSNTNTGVGSPQAGALAASPTTTAPAPAAAPLANWGVYLHPSVFRLHATALDVFLSLQKNGGLASLTSAAAAAAATAKEEAACSAPPPSVVSYLTGEAASLHEGQREHAKSAVAAAQAAQATATAASPLLPPLPQLSATPPTTENALRSQPGQHHATDEAAAAAAAGVPPSREHLFLAYSANGNHPQLVKFDFRVSPALSAARGEDSHIHKAIQRDPLCQQLKSTRINSLEVILPSESEHPQLTPQQLLHNPAVTAASFTQGSGGVGAATREPGVPVVGGGTAPASPEQQAKQAEITRLLSLLQAKNVGDGSADADETAKLRQQVDAVQQCLYGSRRCASSPLFHYTPMPHKACLSGSVAGLRVGCGEGAGLDGSSLLSGIQVALASMHEGEEASFLIASPQGYEYTAPQLKAIAATMPCNAPSSSSATTGGVGLAKGGGGGGVTYGPPHHNTPTAASHSSRSSSTSSSASTSSTTSSRASTEEAVTGKKTKKGLRGLLGLHAHRNPHGGGNNAGSPADKGERPKGRGKEEKGPRGGGGGAAPNAPTTNNGLPAPAVALQLVQHSSSRVLFYTIRLVQRVPLMNVAPASTALTQSFLSLLSSGLGANATTTTTTVMVPRPLESTRGMLRRLSTSWTSVHPRGGGEGEEEQAEPPSQHPSAAVPPGCVNPLAFFARSNFSGDLLSLIDQADPHHPRHAGGGKKLLGSKRMPTAVAPFIATFAVVDGYDHSTTPATTSAAAGDRVVSATGAAAAAAPMPVSTSLPSLSVSSLSADVESVIQRVLGDAKTVRQAQAATYTAVLFAMGSHGNMREVVPTTTTTTIAGGSRGGSPGPASDSATPSATATPRRRTEGMRFEPFSFFDGLDECVSAVPAAAAGNTPSFLRVSYDPTKNPNAALRFLERDFLSFHQLSSTVAVVAEAYNPLVQRFCPLPPPPPPQQQLMGKDTSSNTQQQQHWLVTIGSLVVPCWLDLICRNVPRHGSIASVLHLLSDASDALFMNRLLTDIRHEARRFLEELERVRGKALEHLASHAAPAASVAVRQPVTAEKEDDDEEGKRATEEGGGSLPASATQSPAHGPHPAAAGNLSVKSAILDASTGGLPGTAAATGAPSAPPPTAAATAVTGLCTASSHFTTEDAVAYQCATAPSPLQRRREHAFRVILRSPSAQQQNHPGSNNASSPAAATTATAIAEGGGGNGGGGSLPASSTPSSSSSPTVRKGFFFFANPTNSCGAVRTLLLEACGLLAYYDSNRPFLFDDGQPHGQEQQMGFSADGDGRSHAAAALVRGHQSSLALLLEDDELRELRLEDGVSDLLRPEVLSAVAAAANTVKPATTTSSPSSQINRGGDRGGGNEAASVSTRGEGHASAPTPPPPPSAAVLAVVAAVTVATNPSGLVHHYFSRQHSKFARRAEKGMMASTLNAILLGTTAAAALERGNAGGGSAAPVPLDAVAAAATFLPPQPIPLEQRQHLLRQRILYKVLDRLYTSVLLMTFNVDEAAVRPDSYEEELYERYFPTNSREEEAKPPVSGAAAPSSGKGTVEGEDPATAGDRSREESLPTTTTGVDAGGEDGQQAVYRRRYGYLAEVFQYIALVYAEMPGMNGHAMDAVTAALYYAPREEELWVLRAVLLARQRQYLRASLDLDVATALTEARLAALQQQQQPAGGGMQRSSEENQQESACFYHGRLRLIRLQQQGLAELLEDAHGTLGGGRGRDSRGASGGIGLGAGLFAGAFDHMNLPSHMSGGSSVNNNGATTTVMNPYAANARSPMGGSMPLAGLAGAAAAAGGAAGVSVTSLPVLGSGLLSANGAGSVLH